MTSQKNDEGGRKRQTMERKEEKGEMNSRGTQKKTEKYRNDMESMKEPGRWGNERDGRKWVGDGTWWILLILWLAFLSHPRRGLTYSSDRPPNSVCACVPMCVCTHVCMCLGQAPAGQCIAKTQTDWPTSLGLSSVQGVVRVRLADYYWSNTTETARLSTNNTKEGKIKNKSTMRTAGWCLQGSI